MNKFVKYCVVEEAGSKVDCLVGFFHHPVMTMSAFTHAYRILCSIVEQKQVCKLSLYIDKIIELLFKYNE